MGNVWEAYFTAGVHAKFEGDFADFCARDILKGIKGMSGIDPNGLLDRLKGLGQLIGWIFKDDGTAKSRVLSDQWFSEFLEPHSHPEILHQGATSPNFQDWLPGRELSFSFALKCYS